MSDVTFEDVINDPSEGPIVVVSLVTLPLCIMATILRLVATKRSRRKFAWDDLFAILALIGYLVYALSPFIALATAGGLDDEGVAILLAKLAYVVTPFFYINQLFARGSLFVLYYRIFWSNPTFIKWIYALAAIHVSWFIAFFFAVLFLCTPISKWWDISGTQPGYCLDGNAFLVAEETINSFLDFAMIALTVVMVQNLQTRQFRKTKLTFIFVVGGLSGVIGFVKIGIVYQAANTNGQENDTNAFWDILQMATSTLCACAPMFKTIVPLHGAWLHLRVSFTNWASKTRVYKALPESMTVPSDVLSNSSNRNSPPQIAADWSGAQYAQSDTELADMQRGNQNSAGTKTAQPRTDIYMV